ncbi:hypothetical protein V2O64_17310 [Verrucomicrobiaceae bacterium 227]
MTFTTSLIVGILVTTAIWLTFWPAKDQATSEAITRTPAPQTQKTFSQADLELIANESINYRTRALGIGNLKHLSITSLKASLNKSLLANPTPTLTPAAKILLAEWGRRDPEEALQWAWNHFKNSGWWAETWTQIGKSWAWADPEGFLQFYREHHRGYQSVTPADAERSATPLILGHSVHYYQEWLAKSSLRAAFTYLREKESYYETDPQFTDTLHTEQEFAEALSAWHDYTPDPEKNPNRLHTSEQIALKITDRWREEFPESFAKSRYADWPTLPKMDPPPTPITEKIPKNPDPAEQRDLEVLRELLDR